jgi:hypothetical protein
MVYCARQIFKKAKTVQSTDYAKDQDKKEDATKTETSAES